MFPLISHDNRVGYNVSTLKMLAMQFLHWMIAMKL